MKNKFFVHLRHGVEPRSFFEKYQIELIKDHGDCCYFVEASNASLESIKLENFVRSVFLDDKKTVLWRQSTG